MNTKSLKKDIEAALAAKTFEEQEKEFESMLSRKHWTVWDYITLPFHRAKYAIKDGYYSLKYRCQRFIRGYSDEDVFEFGFNLRTHIIKILRDFIECHNGYSGASEEEYDQKLKDMLYHLEWMDEEKVDDEMRKKYDRYSRKYFEERHQMLESHTDEFFKLFRELYWTLWD